MEAYESRVTVVLTEKRKEVTSACVMWWEEVAGDCYSQTFREIFKL